MSNTTDTADQQETRDAENPPENVQEAPAATEVGNWMARDEDDERARLADEEETAREIREALTEYEGSILSPDGQADQPPSGPVASPPSSDGHRDPVPELPEEVIEQLRNYIRVFTEVRGRNVAAGHFGVSTATVTNWISHKHVGRRLPQLFDELFDSQLDRLMMETNALTAQIPRRRNYRVDGDDTAFAWLQNVLNRRSTSDVSKMLGVDRKTLQRGLRRGAPLTGSLAKGVAEAYAKVLDAGGGPPTDTRMAEQVGEVEDAPTTVEDDVLAWPDAQDGRASTPWVGARSMDVITVEPYPDEEEFFGAEVAFQAMRWRTLRKDWIEVHFPKFKAGKLDLEGLIMREEMYAVELDLIDKHGKTLVSDPNSSNMAVWAPLPLREQISWRERELASVRAERERVEAIIRRKANLRRMIRLWARRATEVGLKVVSVLVEVKDKMAAAVDRRRGGRAS